LVEQAGRIAGRPAHVRPSHRPGADRRPRAHARRCTGCGGASSRVGAASAMWPG